MMERGKSLGDLKKEISDIPHKMKDFLEETILKGHASASSSSTEQVGLSSRSFSSSRVSRAKTLTAMLTNSYNYSEYNAAFQRSDYDTKAKESFSQSSPNVSIGSAHHDFKKLHTGPIRTTPRSTRQATFSETDRKSAIKMVQRGQLLEAVSQDLERALGMRSRCACINCCCRCINRCSKLMNPKTTCFFVVMENRNGHMELRWDPNPDRAVTPLAQGHLLLSEIRDVGPVLVQDDDVDLPISRKFRIIYGRIHMKLWAPDRDSMKEWCVALVALMRSARGSNMRTKQGPDIALRGYINQIFMSILDKGGKVGVDGQAPHIAPPELADWLRKLNISASDEYVGDIIQEFDKDDNQALDLEEFSELFLMLTVKDSLVQWFEKYATLFQPHDGDAKDGKKDIDFSSAHRAMSAERFQLFLELEQGEKHFFSQFTTIDGPYGLFASLPEPYTEVIEGETLLTQAGFSRLMCCAENDLFDPERRARVFQDMTQPLSHYWIATSHNTYLEGHQLVGLSSLEQYMDVLLRGARCVEIDCWDGEDDEPMVTHGWTATSRLQFKDVVRVCRDYAFVTSHYPLILSLEVHCSHEQRCRMASILIDILGDKLLLPNADPEERSLTSPEDARNKVIIKAKRESRNDHTIRSTSTNVKGMRRTTTKSRRGWRCCWFSKWICCCFCKWICCCTCIRRRSSSVNRETFSDNEVAYDEEQVTGKSSTDAAETKTLPDLTYLEGVKFPQTEVDKLNTVDIGLDAYPCTCISVNDTKAGRVIDSNGLSALQRYAKHQILRVYPAAKRVGSSNFDPFSMWSAGVQMVALNYQSLDLPVICNEGLFLHENGGSGYVLKPALVRGFCEPGSPGDSHPVRETSYQNRTVPRKTDASGISRFKSSKNSFVMAMDIRSVRLQGSNIGSGEDREDALGAGLVCTLELTVLSAHSLPKPCGDEEAGIVSPLVRASICGLPEDRRSAETWVVTDNGFNPRWHRLFSFEISEPSMAMLVLEVINVNIGMRRVRREFLAAAALPFTGIREGIRWVPLLDWKHHAVELCGLLVEVRLRGPWAELRRHQRLSRPPAPPRIALEISRGPGGLNHDNVGVLSAARKKTKSRVSINDGSSLSSAHSHPNYSHGISSGGLNDSTSHDPTSPKQLSLGLSSRSLRLSTIKACSFEDDISLHASDATSRSNSCMPPSYQEVVQALESLKDKESETYNSVAVADVSSQPLSAQPFPQSARPSDIAWQTPSEDKVESPVLTHKRPVSSSALCPQTPTTKRSPQTPVSRRMSPQTPASA